MQHVVGMPNKAPQPQPMAMEVETSISQLVEEKPQKGLPSGSSKKGSPKKKSYGEVLSTKPKISKVSSALGECMSILDKLSYSERLMALKGLCGMAGLRLAEPQRIQAPVQVAKQPVPKSKKAPPSKKGKSSKASVPAKQGSEEEAKEVSNTSTVSKKRKRSAPPEPNPANRSTVVVDLKKKLASQILKIKEARESLKVDFLPKDSPLLMERDRILGDLTIAKGSFRAFGNLKVDERASSGPIGPVSSSIKRWGDQSVGLSE